MARHIRTLFISLFAATACLVSVPSAAHAAKQQSVDFTIYFQNSSSEIDLNYKDNAEVVTAVKRELRNTQFMQRVDSIVVIASASPDGRETQNITLAWQRAATIKSFVQRHMQGNINISTFSTINSWKSLGNYIYKLEDIKNKEEILDIIYDFETPAECEAELKKLNNGHTWNYLSKEILPYFRFGWTQIILFSNSKNSGSQERDDNRFQGYMQLNDQEFSDNYDTNNDTDDSYFNTTASLRSDDGGYDFDNSDDSGDSFNNNQQQSRNNGWRAPANDFYSNDDNDDFEVSPQTSLTGSLNSFGVATPAPTQRRATTRTNNRRAESRAQAKEESNNNNSNNFSFDNSSDSEKKSSLDTWLQDNSQNSGGTEVQNFQTSERATNFYVDSKSGAMMTPQKLNSIQAKQQEAEAQVDDDDPNDHVKLELQVVKHTNPAIAAREKRIAERDTKEKIRLDKRRVGLEGERNALVRELNSNPSNRAAIEKKIQKIDTQLEEDRIKLLIKEQKEKSKAAIDMERSIATSKENEIITQKKIAEAKEKQEQKSVKNKKRVIKRQQNRSKKWVDEEAQQNIWGEEVKPATQPSKAENTSSNEESNNNANSKNTSNETFFKTSMPEYR
ncbi:MAG: hypothetical protein SNH01_06405 [Rikenellaceae bacterium]